MLLHRRKQLISSICEYYLIFLIRYMFSKEESSMPVNKTKALRTLVVPSLSALCCILQRLKVSSHIVKLTNLLTLTHN